MKREGRQRRPPREGLEERDGLEDERDGLAVLREGLALGVLARAAGARLAGAEARGALTAGARGALALGLLGRAAGAAEGALPRPEGVRRTGWLDPRGTACEPPRADAPAGTVAEKEPRPPVAPGPLRRTEPPAAATELPAGDGPEPARDAGVLPTEPSEDRAAALRCVFTRAFALAVVLFFENICARLSWAPRFFGTTESGTPASFIEGPFGRTIAADPPFDLEAPAESGAL